jgi:recombination protein RecR
MQNNHHCSWNCFGGELEYADEMTLARSLANRLPIQQYVK